MKKFVIGLMVLGTLVLYSLGIRHEQPKIGATGALTHSPTSSAPSTSDDPPDGTNGGSSNMPMSGNMNQHMGSYKDGSYTGSVADAYYGNVQVKVTVSGGKITDVSFLQYPNTHSTSVYINDQAMPYLQQEAIQAQIANVNIISGATYTSQAFIESLTSALNQA